LKRILISCLILLGLPFTALAETVYLNSGESIQGHIVRADQDTISIESKKGFGVITVNRAEVLYIVFEAGERSETQKVGVGYYHRSTPSNVGAQAAEYGIDALSVKYWLSDTSAAELQMGFYSSNYKNKTLLKVFSLDARYMLVAKRLGGVDVYYGASAGYMSVEDNTIGRNVAGNGISLRAFGGVELFFTSMPNLGISAEVGFGTQTVGNSSTTNISTTTFPALSLRYYF